MIDDTMVIDALWQYDAYVGVVVVSGTVVVDGAM